MNTVPPALPACLSGEWSHTHIHTLCMNGTDTSAALSYCLPLPTNCTAQPSGRDDIIAGQWHYSSRVCFFFFFCFCFFPVCMMRDGEESSVCVCMFVIGRYASVFYLWDQTDPHFHLIMWSHFIFFLSFLMLHSPLGLLSLFLFPL